MQLNTNLFLLLQIFGGLNYALFLGKLCKFAHATRFAFCACALGMHELITNRPV